MRAQQSWAVALLGSLLSLFLVSCSRGYGGGGIGGNGDPSTPGGGSAPRGKVTIIQPSVRPTVVTGSRLTFAANVQNSNGMGLSWGVQSENSCANGSGSLGTLGGDSTLGTITTDTASGTVATYTAPPAPHGALNVTITAVQSPGTTGPCVGVGVYSENDQLLNGQFMFRLRGFSSPSGLPFGIIGRFVAQGGSGIIAFGLEDINIAQADGSSVAFTTVAFSGSFNMDTPDHGTMTWSVTSPPWNRNPPANPPPTTMTFSFTLSQGRLARLIETDGTTSPGYVGSGEFRSEGAGSNFLSNIGGGYVFSLAGTAGVGTSAVSKGLLGRLDLVPTLGSSTEGTIASTSTSDDETLPGPTALTGTYTIDNTLDHGIFNITGGASPTVSFYRGTGILYALRTDNLPAGNDAILIGVAHAIAVDSNGQPITFRQTSLSGSYIFNLLGINGNGHASAAVGRFATGSPFAHNNVSISGFFDSNDGGSVPGNLAFGAANGPASLLIDASGRGNLTIFVTSFSSTATYSFIFYLESTDAGFLLEQPANDGSKRGRSGSFVRQTVAPPIVAPGLDATFDGGTEVATAASANGMVVLALNGGTDSSGNFNGTEYLESSGPSPILGAFTLTDQDNGRGTFTATDTTLGSKTLVLYIVSPGEIVALGIDSANSQPQLITVDE